MHLCTTYPSCTGCSLNIVFFPKILEYSRLCPFSVFPWCQCVYTHTRQVQHQRGSRTDRVQKNHKILRKKIFNEHPVYRMPNIHQQPICNWISVVLIFPFWISPLVFIHNFLFNLMMCPYTLQPALSLLCGWKCAVILICLYDGR